MTENLPRISGAGLKLIAIFCMTIDHAAVIFVPQGTDTYVHMRMVGRFAFPIFAFLLTEGLKYTKNRYLYLKNLFLFGLISTPSFYLVFRSGLNVMFTLFLGGLAITLIDRISKTDAGRNVLKCFIKTFLQGVIFITIFLTAIFLKTDYDGIGIIVIMAFYYLPRITHLPDPLIYVFCCAILGVTAFIEDDNPESIYAFIPMMAYDRSRGKQNKWFFYFYYPLHLLVLYGIKMLFLNKL